MYFTKPTTFFLFCCRKLNSTSLSVLKAVNPPTIYLIQLINIRVYTTQNKYTHTQKSLI